MLDFWGSLLSGGIKGITEGIGSLAKDIRAAITGESVLSSEQRVALLERMTALEAAAMQAEANANQGQIEINKIDANNPSMFRGGYRPAAAWVCVLGLAYNFLLRPLLPFIFEISGVEKVPELPSLDLSELLPLLGGLLGLSAMRMNERIKGVAAR